MKLGSPGSSRAVEFIIFCPSRVLCLPVAPLALLGCFLFLLPSVHFSFVLVDYAVNFLDLGVERTEELEALVVLLAGLLELSDGLAFLLLKFTGQVLGVFQVFDLPLVGACLDEQFAHTAHQGVDDLANSLVVMKGLAAQHGEHFEEVVTEAVVLDVDDHVSELLRDELLDAVQKSRVLLYVLLLIGLVLGELGLQLVKLLVALLAEAQHF